MFVFGLVGWAITVPIEITNGGHECEQDGYEDLCVKLECETSKAWYGTF